MEEKFLTPEGKAKLEHELDNLVNVRRVEIAERLREAIEDGDGLGEDAEYESAKNDQAFIEGRIREIEILLSEARIIDTNSKHDVVVVGAKVTIQENGTKPEIYTIVGAAEANPREGLISHVSPLGKALLGHKKGETVEVKAPSGSFSVKIVKVK